MNGFDFDVDRPVVIRHLRKDGKGGSYDYEAMDERVPVVGYHKLYRNVGFFEDLTKDEVKEFNKLDEMGKRAFCKVKLIQSVRNFLKHLEGGGEG